MPRASKLPTIAGIAGLAARSHPAVPEVAEAPPHEGGTGRPGPPGPRGPAPRVAFLRKTYQKTREFIGELDLEYESEENALTDDGESQESADEDGETQESLSTSRPDVDPVVLSEPRASMKERRASTKGRQEYLWAKAKAVVLGAQKALQHRNQLFRKVQSCIQEFIERERAAKHIQESLQGGEGFGEIMAALKTRFDPKILDMLRDIVDDALQLKVPHVLKIPDFIQTVLSYAMGNSEALISLQDSLLDALQEAVEEEVGDIMDLDELRNQILDKVEGFKVAMQQASEAQVQRKIQLSSAPQDNAMDTHIDLDFHESEQQQDNEEEPDHRSQENATETSSHSADLLVDMEEGETKAVPAVVFSAEAAGEGPPDPGSVLAAEAEARPMTSQEVSRPPSVWTATEVPEREPLRTPSIPSSPKVEELFRAPSMKPTVDAVKKCKGWSPAQERRKPVEAAFSAADEFARVPEEPSSSPMSPSSSFWREGLHSAGGTTSSHRFPVQPMYRAREAPQKTKSWDSVLPQLGPIEPSGSFSTTNGSGRFAYRTSTPRGKLPYGKTPRVQPSAPAIPHGPRSEALPRLGLGAIPCGTHSRT